MARPKRKGSHLSKSVTIPLYGARFVLVVADDVTAARACYDKEFGTHDEPDDASEALTFVTWPHGGIFLPRNGKLSHGIIGHEVMHLTNFLMSRVGATPDLHNTEPHCYLCQWITDHVYRQLRAWRVRVHYR